MRRRSWRMRVRQRRQRRHCSPALLALTLVSLPSQVRRATPAYTPASSRPASRRAWPLATRASILVPPPAQPVSRPVPPPARTHAHPRAQRVFRRARQHAAQRVRSARVNRIAPVSISPRASARASLANIRSVRLRHFRRRPPRLSRPGILASTVVIPRSPNPRVTRASRAATLV